MQQSELESRIISQIVDSMGKIQELDIKAVKQIAKAFNINTNLDLNIIHRKIKLKITTILLYERQSYVDYLSLKKFATISEEVKRVLISTMKVVWEQFDRRINMQQNQTIQKRIKSLLPTFKTIKDYQIYHLNMLGFIRKSISHQINSPINHYPPQNIRSQFQINNFPTTIYSTQPNFMMDYRFQPNINSQYAQRQWQTHNQYHTIQETYNMPTFKSNFNSQSMFPPVNTIQSNNEIYLNSYQFIPNNMIANFIQPQINNSFNYYHQPQINSEINKQKIQIHQQYPQQIYYSNCACLGNRQDYNMKYIKCQKCLNIFHQNCLKINKQKLNYINFQCPSCLLSTENIFFNVKETIESGWIKFDATKYGYKFRIRKQNIIKIYNLQNPHRYGIYLRLMQINSDTLNKDAQNINDKVNILQKISSIKVNVQSQTNLLQDYIVSVNPRNINKTNRQIDQQLYYFATYLMQIKPIQQVVQQLIYNSNNHVGSQFLNSFFLNGIQSNTISISLSNIYKPQQIIDIPARGQKCNHPAVFDLKTFLQYHFQYYSLVLRCPICKLDCQKIIIDDFIKENITVDSQGKSPYKFQYYQNGHIKYGDIKLLKQYKQQNHLGQIIKVETCQKIKQKF